MKFAVALSTAFVAAQAASIEAQAGAADWPTYPNYYLHDHYAEPSYDATYDEELPGADFNSHVYHFEDENMIWDQNDYTERVRVEAEMLVALEGLKETVTFLHHDIDHLNDVNDQQAERIHENHDDIYDNQQYIINSLDDTKDHIALLQHMALHSEHDLKQNRAALTLYCQQFAFATEMVAPCEAVLVDRDTELA